VNEFDGEFDGVTDSETDDNPREGSEELTAQKIIKKEETRLLKCKYTGKEKAELSMKMADAVTKINGFDADFKSVKSQFSSRIDEQKAIVTHCASALTSGSEVREVEVIIELNYETNTYLIVRQDNYDTIEERPLTDSEKQMEFHPASQD
jgi:hypothetical protein